jgi:hypothetical protein
MHRVRKHLTPSTAIAFLALIFAVTGVSFAATGAGSGSGRGNQNNSRLVASTAKAKPKTKAGPRGPAGPKGATGATGAVGPAGPGGPAGPAGNTGPAGANGTNGTNGEKGATGEPGTPGEQGIEGKPGVIQPGETLPSGASETGTWSITIGKGIAAFGGLGAGVSPISFTVPLATALPETNVKIEPEEYEGTESACPNDTKKEREENKPQVAKAEPGFLCVYTSENAGQHLKPEVHENTPSGVVLADLSNEEGVFAYGTWAVTAP